LETEEHKDAGGALMSKKRPRVIILWHHGRSGSTVLGEKLQASGYFHDSGEILENLSWKALGSNPFKSSLLAFLGIAKIYYYILSAFLGRFRRKILVLHLKDAHFERFGFSLDFILKCLRFLHCRHHILLTRKNGLNQVLSIYLARARGGKWHTKEQLDKKTLFVDMKELAQKLTEWDRFLEATRKLKISNGLYLTYEDHIENDPDEAYFKVLEWLSLEKKPTQTILKKTNQFRLEEIVINWREVESLLKGTSLEWMLEPPPGKPSSIN